MSHSRRLALLLLVFVPCIALSRSVETITGRVVGVHDGDTITVLTDDKREIKTRLDGIDAPELSQAFGQAAKKALSTLVFGRVVELRITGHDCYKRALARVFVASSDVNRELVRLGYAWRYEQYSQEPALIEAQSEAKAAKRGLWQDFEPLAPWLWRKAKRP